MRRKYTKPILVVESFQLATDIATTLSCKVNINKTQDECTYDMGGALYFSGHCGNNGGTDVVNPNEFGDDLCYHGYNSGFIFIAS